MAGYDSYKDSGVKWLGEIPSHWQVKKLKNFLTFFTEKGFPDKQLLSVTREKGVIQRDVENKDENHNSIPKDLSGYKHVMQGDFVVNKMKSWQGSYGLSRYEGIVSPAYFTFHLNNVDKEFFSRAIRSKAYIGFFMRYSKGIRVDQWDLDDSAIKEIPFILPPLPEQTAIAEYLDKETSKIDTAIAQQQKMIDLLNERKQIIINQAVTKGLDTNAKMKDSGVEWIGEIPAEWEVVKLKYNLSLKGRIGWNGLRSDEYQSSSYAYLVTGQDFKGIVVDWSKCYQVSKARYDEDPFIQLKNGDILVTKDGSIGKIAKVLNLDKPACLNSGIFVVKQLHNVFEQDYLYWLFSSSVLKEFNRYTQTGATILHLYQNVFEQMPCLIPPKDIQHQIAEHLNKKCLLFDKAIESYNKQIALLQERKQILINEVVTGKVKVC